MSATELFRSLLFMSRTNYLATSRLHCPCEFSAVVWKLTFSAISSFLAFLYRTLWSLLLLTLCRAHYQLVEHCPTHLASRDAAGPERTWHAGRKQMGLPSCFKGPCFWGRGEGRGRKGDGPPPPFANSWIRPWTEGGARTLRGDGARVWRQGRNGSCRFGVGKHPLRHASHSFHRLLLLQLLLLMGGKRSLQRWRQLTRSRRRLALLNAQCLVVLLST